LIVPKFDVQARFVAMGNERQKYVGRDGYARENTRMSREIPGRFEQLFKTTGW
jgi:hypothetical protein